jgi:2-polyprenyl-6-methoxyphenol hydroxylase-like FAD-dependent oxidoreductase
MIFPQQVDVLVVGAGPTGLALACTLQQAGVDVLALDAVAQGANTSRAAVVHARTLEVLESLDVTRRLVAEGCVVPVFTVRDRLRLLARVDFSGLPSAYPYTLMLPQSRTEAILGDRLVELGGQVYRPWKADTVTATTNGATVTMVGPQGQRHSIQARYVVGADGVHSTVREAAEIGFTGGRYTQSFVLADIRMDWPLPPEEVQLFFSPSGLVVVAPLPGGSHRVVATVDSAPREVTAADVQALLDERGPGRAHVVEVLWGSRFQIHHRVADSYRKGPLLLAGDAAHVHSPAGGQGMNIGIHDAVDLGETLAAVLRHGASDEALDQYQERRRPIALGVVSLTDRATRLATLTNPAARSIRNAAIALAGRIPAVQRRLARQLAELPVDGTR